MKIVNDTIEQQLARTSLVEGEMVAKIYTISMDRFDVIQKRLFKVAALNLLKEKPSLSKRIMHLFQSFVLTVFSLEVNDEQSEVMRNEILSDKKELNYGFMLEFLDETVRMCVFCSLKKIPKI